MSRSAADATRFTATRPHAHSKTLHGTTIELAGSPPPNETPAQKVNRLRDAARRAKLSQESTWERIILRGRVVADVVHKTVATGLILASIVGTGFAVLSLGGMMLANRRKKTRFFKDQQENYDKALALAKKADADGTITPGLRLVLNNENAIEQAEAEKQARLGFFAKIKKTAFGGLAFEETRSLSRAADADTAVSPVDVAMEGNKIMQDTAPETSVGSTELTMMHDAQDSRVVESRATGKLGGPLDRLGEQAASSLSTSSQRWYHLVTRRS